MDCAVTNSVSSSEKSEATFPARTQAASRNPSCLHPARVLVPLYARICFQRILCLLHGILDHEHVSAHRDCPLSSKQHATTTRRRLAATDRQFQDASPARQKRPSPSRLAQAHGQMMRLQRYAASYDLHSLWHHGAGTSRAAHQPAGAACTNPFADHMRAPRLLPLQTIPRLIGCPRKRSLCSHMPQRLGMAGHHTILGEHTANQLKILVQYCSPDICIFCGCITL
jgi:hypothetical protein